MFKVKKEQCDTCIFLPGNLMDLNPGRVAEMVSACRQKDSYITCHDTLEQVTGTTETEAACRGYLNTGAYPQMLRIAERLNMVEEV